MKIGIVGSRRRNSLVDRGFVFKIVQNARQHYGDQFIVVSGGCPKGADRFAEEAAKCLDVETKIFGVKSDKPIESKYEFRKLAYARNEVIAQESDIVFALVADDRKGGTENTIQHALKLRKKVFIVDGTGRTYLADMAKDYVKSSSENRNPQT